MRKSVYKDWFFGVDDNRLKDLFPLNYVELLANQGLNSDLNKTSEVY